MIEIEIFKKNLFWIRWLFGWSTRELADRIGVSQELVSNIERKSDYPLSKVNYYAMRYVMDHEIIYYPLEYADKYGQLLTEVFDKKLDRYPLRNIGARAIKVLFS